jgi:hypothetical protein
MARIPGSGWILDVTEIPRMNEEQLKAARRLIRQHCCNFQQGSCIAVDWAFCNICPQWNSYSVICKWFRSYVMPLNKDLTQSVLYPYVRKQHCNVCKKLYVPTGPNSKYCEICAKTQKTKNARIRKARSRARMSRF